jgi:hypothetical protein
MQVIRRSTGFGVFPCDGFATTVISSGDDAALQLSFWIVDGTPDFEDNTKAYQDTDRYEILTKHLMQTAVKLKPDVALQMAINILESLSNLPENVRQKYQLPRGVEVKKGSG